MINKVWHEHPLWELNDYFHETVDLPKEMNDEWEKYASTTVWVSRMHFLFWLIHEYLIKRVWFCDVMVERGFRNNLAIHGSFLLRKEVVQTGFEDVSDE